MIVSMPLIFMAEVTSRSPAAKVRTVELYEHALLEIMEISEDGAPVATEWIDRRLGADGRPAVTRSHEGRHYRRLHGNMFDGFHSMSPPLTADAVVSAIRAGNPVCGPFSVVGDAGMLARCREEKIKFLRDVEDRYADIDRTELVRRQAEFTQMAASVALIGGHLWYECSEPALMLIPPADATDIHRVLVTTEDDPLHDLLLRRGAVKFRADRHEDAIAMIEDTGEIPSGSAMSARITIHMPETITMDDDAAALTRCADAAIMAVGSQVARLMQPHVLLALADIMRARSEHDLSALSEALSALAQATDLAPHDLNHEEVLARWSHREREFELSF